MVSNHIQKSKLNNGLTIVSELIPNLKSVAIGVWVKIGSRYENDHNKGIVHFIEHMLFKGTQKRSAFEIASSLEEVGGNLNAFTGKEETCFYVHTLDTHLEKGVEVLADMICNSLFAEDDISLEQQVVIEEIKSVLDTPEEHLFDLFQQESFPNQPIGYPILGTVSSVNGFNRKALKSFWSNHYSPENIIISVAGQVNHERLIDLVNKYFTFQNKADIPTIDSARPVSGIVKIYTEQVNQSHICIGGRATSYKDEKRFDLMALNTYLGAGLSAQLFQVLREKLGYVYSIYSFLDLYSDMGIIGFYLGTDPKNREPAIEALLKEVEKVRTTKLKNTKVHTIREQIKGSYFLAMESTFKRMTRLAKNEIYYEEQFADAALINKIDSITADSILNCAQLYLDSKDLNTVILTSEKQSA